MLLFGASAEEAGMGRIAWKVRPTDLSIEQYMPDPEFSYTVSIELDQARLFLASSVSYRLIETGHTTHWLK